MNIYILRHGETDWNKETRIQGSTDIPLNGYGIHLAEVTAEALKKQNIIFDRVYSSPLIRAYRTAEIVCAGSHVQILKDDRLREISFGSAEGVKVSESKTNPKYKNMDICFTKPSQYHAEESAESYEQVLARASDFLENEIKPLEGKYRNVLAVCHGGIIRALLMHVAGWKLDTFWDIFQPNCCMNLLKLESGRFSIQFMEKIYYDGDIAAKGIL